MEKLEKYRAFVQEILSELGSRKTQFPEVEKQIIFDTARDHYQIVNVGWRNGKRTYGCSVHIDLKNDKIWIQQNLTEIDLAQELMEKGVPKSDIVLAFQAPEIRKYTDFAVA